MLTQAGRKRFALEGTRFQFHRSEVQIPDVLLNHGYVNEALCHGLLDHIAIANAISLAGLLEHGTSETVIGNLFATEADIDATRARRIRLIDGFYAHSDFRKDRGIVREIIRAKRVRKIKAA